VKENIGPGTAEQARLKKLSKATGVAMEELLKDYEEALVELINSEVEGNRERLAVNSVMNKHRRAIQRQTWKPRTPPVVVYGFIAGDAGMRDKADEMRRKTKRIIEKEGTQYAQDMQLINGDNEILDQREKIFGRDNPKHLEPLDPKLRLRSRTLFGFFKLNGKKKFRFGSIHTEDNKLAFGWSKIKTFTPCQTFAILKEDTPTTIKLNSSQAEDTMSVFKRIDEPWGKTKEDIHKVIMATIGKEITPLNGVEEHYKNFKDAWDRKIFVKGIVSWISLDRPSPWGSIWMGLMDPDAGIDEEFQVRVQIPKHLRIDWGEQSEVIIFGKDRREMVKTEDGEGREPGGVVIDVYGVWVIPGLGTPPASTQIETLSDEEEIEGWID